MSSPSCFVLRVHRPGGYDRLSLEEDPMPQPGPGEVRVRTHAVGVNYADCAVRGTIRSNWLPGGPLKSDLELITSPGGSLARIVE